MAAIRLLRGTALLSLLISFSAAGCVDSFDGSNIQFTLAGGVHVPGSPSDFGRPPAGTHYEFYAVEHVTDTDMDGNETIVQTFTYKVATFEVLPVINLASPCFIEDDESLFPGLHITHFAEKLREHLGVTDPFDPSVPANDAIDILTAEVRMDNLGKLANGIKAVASHDPADYPTDIPAADSTGEAANAERKQKCEAFWAAHPNRYEGSDKVFTLPLNGAWFGAADGSDPRNAQFLGGAGFFVDAALSQVDGLQMNWQYDCDDDDYLANGFDCAPVYPDALPDAEKSIIGVHYMSGAAVSKTRGVINIPMANRIFGQISGEAAIWFDLDDDDVQF